MGIKLKRASPIDNIIKGSKKAFISKNMFVDIVRAGMRYLSKIAARVAEIILEAGPARETKAVSRFLS